MLQLFTPASRYKRQSRFIAMLWTLIILTGCFMPARAVPEVDVPLADKWVHFIFFGGFTFTWLCSRPVLQVRWLITIGVIAIAFGSFIEIMQGVLTFLGRASEFMDAVADSIGAVLGILLFALLASFAKSRA